MVKVTVDMNPVVLLEAARAVEVRAQANEGGNRPDLARKLRVLAQKLESAVMEIEERSSSSQSTSQGEGRGSDK